MSAHGPRGAGPSPRPAGVVLALQAAPRTNKLLGRVLEMGGSDIASRCEEVQLVFAAVIAMPGDELLHAYFPTHGYLSLVSIAEGDQVEVGMVGDEGMVGIGMVNDISMSNVKVVVLGAGSALRMPVPALVEVLKGDQVLQAELARYRDYLVSEFIQAAACNRFHALQSRLARWLLMTANRAHSESFDTTQEFGAAMLGVRRVGVTEASIDLHARGLIEYKRGRLRIVDRPGLEKMACNCYPRDQRAYKRICALDKERWSPPA